MFESGVQKPAKQSEAPFVQMVLSASPSYFRDEGQGPGEWNPEKLDAWVESTMAYLKDNFGSDVIHVALHLDEDTPHLHVLIAPTYEKKPRVPGKQKRNETDEEFAARKEAAKTAPGVRTVGRASNEFWKQNYCKRKARQLYHAAVEHLGIGYGKDFVGEGLPSPEHKTTGEWVREQAASLNTLENFLEEQADKLEKSRMQDVLERAELISDVQMLNENVEALETRKNQAKDELSSLSAQREDLAANVETLSASKTNIENELSSLSAQWEDLAAQLQVVSQQISNSEVRRQKAELDRKRAVLAAEAAEKGAQSAAERLQQSEQALQHLEVLRPAVDAAQALSALTAVDPTTRAALFESMCPFSDADLSRDADKDAWATAIRMCDPQFGLDIAPHVPRSEVTETNYNTLCTPDLTSDRDLDALLDAMRQEPGGPDAVLALQSGEFTQATLREPADTPAKGWLGRAFEGVKRGFAYARAAVSEKTVALAGVVQSLPAETQAALSHLFRSKDATGGAQSAFERDTGPDPSPW